MKPFVMMFLFLITTEEAQTLNPAPEPVTQETTHDIATFDINPTDYTIANDTTTDTTNYEFTDDTSDVWKDVLTEIAIGVAITEGMNLLVKHQKKIYAALKPIERTAAVRTLIKVGLTTYDNYVTWTKLMDNIKGLVDNVENTKVMIEEASRTIDAICEYYKEFEWKKLRPTNLSSIIPQYHLYALDYYINGSIYYAEQAMKHLEFSSYVIEDVVRNPTKRNRIQTVNQQIAATYAEISKQNRLLDGADAVGTQPAIEGLFDQAENIVKNQVSGNNEMFSGKQYHASSLMTSLSYSLQHTRVRVVGKDMLNAIMLLDYITAEAKDWEKERAFVSGIVNREYSNSGNVFGLPDAPIVFNRPPLEFIE